MWRSLIADYAHPVLHQAGPEEAPDDAKEAFVADPARDSGHENIVVHFIEKFLGIKVHDKPAPLLSYVFPALFESHMGASSRPETKAGVREGGVEDGVQHLQNRLLNEAVHNYRDTRLAFSSSRLPDLYSTYWLGQVSPVQQRSR